MLLTDTTNVGASNTVSHQFLHGPEVDQVFADETSQNVLLWALSDLNGSVRDVSTYDVSTDVTTIGAGNHRTFDSFGVVTGTPTDWFAYGYTGREYDQETGLQYNRDRWYDARVVRFLSEDPIGFAAGDGNLNRYVFNDPLTNSDPSGNSWLSKLWKKTKNVFKDVGNFFENAWDIPSSDRERVFEPFVTLEETVHRDRWRLVT